MHCYVPYCENTSESAGITFYKFPSALTKRTAWLQALDKQESCLPHGAVVCSHHFSPDDFIVTKSGVKKLRSGAVPYVTYELELFEQKPVVIKYAEMEIQGNIDSVIKNEETQSMLGTNNITQIKQELSDQGTELTCFNMYDSQFEVLNHEVCENSSGTYQVRELATGSLFTNNAYTCVAPVPATLATNTVLAKQEVDEQSETNKNDMRDNDTGSNNFYCMTTGLCELPTSETSNVEHPTLDTHTTVNKLSSNIDTNVRNNTEEDKIVDTNSEKYVKEKSFVCDICQHVFTDQHVLLKHIDSHKKYRFTCKICPFQSKFNSGMISHMRSHTGDKPFICKICEYKCSEKSRLVKHHLRAHSTEKPFACTSCEYKCNERGKLNIHMKNHTGKPYACKFCQHKCNQKGNLAQHMKIHTGIKPFECEVCQYKCRIKARLVHHMRTHTGEKPFACVLCEYKCTMKSSLNDHMKKHTDVKPYACKLCPYKGKRNKNLLNHMRTHTGEKPFACEFCQYRCTLGDALVRHMRIHTGEKRFSCNLCEYKCSDNSNFKRHMRTHSKQQSQP